MIESKHFNRTIGLMTGDRHGPMLIIFGAMHGNELAGPYAIEYMIKMLEVEPITNPDFLLTGKILGILGNKSASRQKCRYLDHDMNRLWRQDLIDDQQVAYHEIKEIRSVLRLLKKEIRHYHPTELIILDIHTTSSEGGIFVIPQDNPRAIDIASGVDAPVVQGMLDDLEGTSMHYFTAERMGIPTAAITFEAGQHDDPLSINRAIACIIRIMCRIGMVDQRHVRKIHSELLQHTKKGLPKLTRLIQKFQINDGDQYIMEPGFRNFQQVKKGQIIGYINGNPVKSEHDAFILMPLYQKQGNEAFFLVKEITP